MKDGHLERQIGEESGGHAGRSVKGVWHVGLGRLVEVRTRSSNPGATREKRRKSRRTKVEGGVLYGSGRRKRERNVDQSMRPMEKSIAVPRSQGSRSMRSPGKVVHSYDAMMAWDTGQEERRLCRPRSFVCRSGSASIFELAIIFVTLRMGSDNTPPAVIPGILTLQAPSTK